MKRLLLTAIAVLALAPTAFAGTELRSHPRIAPLTFNVTHTRSAFACTRPLPDAWQVAVWVSVNGHNLKSTTNGRLMYYAGQGTLVRLHPYAHNGPVCARGITWLPTASIRVRLVVLN